jgi:hypothetical protein
MLGLVTKDNWHEYLEDTEAMCSFPEYVNANTDIADKLDEILKNAASFKELKSQLSEFVQERRDFVVFAKKHYP